MSNLLSDAEIDAVWVATPDDVDGNDFVLFARLIEAKVIEAYRARLTAGVEVPPVKGRIRVGEAAGISAEWEDAFNLTQLREYGAAQRALGAKEQSVVNAARQWWCERTISDWDEAELAKAVIRLDGDWPGCEGCDFQCGEPCVPATMIDELRSQWMALCRTFETMLTNPLTLKEVQQIIKLRAIDYDLVDDENTRLKELLGQALSTLHGWAGIGNWIWPESALATAKKNTSETITAIENHLQKDKP